MLARRRGPEQTNPHVGTLYLLRRRRGSSAWASTVVSSFYHLLRKGLTAIRDLFRIPLHAQRYPVWSEGDGINSTSLYRPIQGSYQPSGIFGLRLAADLGLLSAIGRAGT
jgi:hypothetical protein